MSPKAGGKTLGRYLEKTQPVNERTIKPIGMIQNVYS